MRAAPRCRYYGVCGGCAMQHVEMRAQVAAKQRVLEDALWHIGKVRPDEVMAPIYGEPWGYRHRARLSVRLVPKKGGVLVGFHEKRSSYVADMLDCEVLPRPVAALVAPLRALIGGLSIADRLPQIEVAVGDAVTVLVLRILAPLTAADEIALRTFAGTHRIQFWLQPEGPETAYPFHPLDAAPLSYGLPEFGVRIVFKPTDFTQVNHAVNRLLVSRAVRLLDPRPGERVLDLFCGLGNFTLPLARRGAACEGLVARARANAAANGIDASFSVANLFAESVAAALPGADKVLIDPPREGALEVAKGMAGIGAGRIVYVSCDPATLARDAGILVHTHGYRLDCAGVVNMFPHTAHVESIAKFARG
jgi:23S rRNA (uracil1939-C5)-methyltransferase